ncbi:MAG: CehA/McbA family metallohydrolase [Candidatus Hydrogenedentota bacterium]
MTVRIAHPYSAEHLPWLRGNLHAHTTLSDGALEPQALVDAYAALGHDFLMISDHDHFTKVRALDGRGMALIPGNEITAYGVHLLHVNAHRRISPDKDRQRIIDAINTDGGFCVVNHPNWLEQYNHCDQELLHTWQDYTGIEIYNGDIRGASGSPYAMDRWDMVLASGRRVWGFANDDAHTAREHGLGWNSVQCDSRKPAHIVRALRAGRFCASTGVAITAVHVDGATIRIETDNAQRIHTVTDLGRVVATCDAAAAEFTVSEDFPYTYVRFECHGPRDYMGWTQPFFVERAGA